MVGINCPPLESWNADKYVILWLKAGHHGALDKATGLSKVATVILLSQVQSYLCNVTTCKSDVLYCC